MGFAFLLFLASSGNKEAQWFFVFVGIVGFFVTCFDQRTHHFVNPERIAMRFAIGLQFNALLETCLLGVPEAIQNEQLKLYQTVVVGVTKGVSKAQVLDEISKAIFKRLTSALPLPDKSLLDLGAILRSIWPDLTTQELEESMNRIAK